MLQDPNHRTDSELANIRSFRDAAKHMLQNAKRQVTQQSASHHMQLYSSVFGPMAAPDCNSILLLQICTALVCKIQVFLRAHTKLINMFAVTSGNTNRH